MTAGSAATAAWLRNHAGVDAPVVLPGIDPFFLEDSADAAVEASYLFHAASGDPREDTVVLLEALAAVRPRRSYRQRRTWTLTLGELLRLHVWLCGCVPPTKPANFTR